MKQRVPARTVKPGDTLLIRQGHGQAEQEFEVGSVELQGKKLAFSDVPDYFDLEEVERPDVKLARVSESAVVYVVRAEPEESEGLDETPDELPDLGD